MYLKGGYWWVPVPGTEGFRYRCTYEKDRKRALTYLRQQNLRATETRNIQLLFEMTLGAAITRYVEIVLLSRGKSATRRVRRSARNEILRVRRLEDFFGRDVRLTELLQPQLVSEFNYTLLHEMKPASANRYLSVLRALLNRAYEWGAIPHRPSISLNRSTTPPFRALTSQQEHKLIESCPNSIRDFIMFLLDTGARKSEALELTWNNVDLDRKPRPIVVLTETKSGRPRAVPLPIRTAENLKYRRRQIPLSQRLVFSERARKNIWNTHDVAILYAQKGNWIPLSALQPKWEQARRDAGIPGCRLHDLRHTYASKLVRNGVSLLQVARLLGHSSINLTMRYSHLTVRDLDECVAHLDFPIDGRRRPFSAKSRAAETRRQEKIAALKAKNAKRRASPPKGLRSVATRKLNEMGDGLARH